MSKYPIRTHRRPGAQPGMTRREFLSRAAAAGMALGMPPLLSSCGGDEAPSQAPRAMEQRVLFFNLAHQQQAGAEYHLNIAGQRFRLTPVSEAPQVLQTARQDNAFLRAIPNDAITHHVEASLPSDAVTLGYLSTMEDPVSGTWAIPMTYLSLPESAHANAVSARRALPHSAKRRSYGIPAAVSARDLREEAALIDSHDHAHALVGVHAELLCLDPQGAAYIHANYISQDPDTMILANQLKQMGTATVQQTPGQLNPKGWATMQPLMNTLALVSPPIPYKKSDGKLNLYTLSWHPDIKTAVAHSILAIHPFVHDDETLGLDITGASNGTPVPPAAVKGRIWRRHDGLANLQRNPATAASNESAPTLTLTRLEPETGLAVQQPTLSVGNKGTDITLDNVGNWFLRWLGMWVQFYGPDGAVIPANQLPPGTLSSYQVTHPQGLDTVDTLFVGILPQADTLLGIPFQPGKFEPVIQMPGGAASMQVLYGGLGLSGSDSEFVELKGPGVLATAFINYFVVGLFLVVGDVDMEGTGKLAVQLFTKGLVEELVLLTESIENRARVDVEAMVLTFCKTVFEAGATTAVATIIRFIRLKLSEAEVRDSIPAVGEIAQAVGAVLDLLAIAETSLEVAISPPVYRFNLVLTHTLTLNIRPDGQFPQAAGGETLYYKVSYLFDNGTPHVLNAVGVTQAPSGAIPVTLNGIPRGGRVNVIVGFYMRKTGTPVGQNDWCAAQGSTGLVDNNIDQAPDIHLKNSKVPIQRDTIYVHTSKTALKTGGQNGGAQHVWQADPDGTHAPAYIPPPNDQQPGLGGFRGITVRQSVASQAGYVGYAWGAYSSGLLGCAAKAPGQFDYFANLNTNPNITDDKQSGYINSSCGMASGALLSYNLLSDDVGNVCLEADTGYLRPVTLGSTPAFPVAGAGMALGQLNLPSTRALLHPSGAVISINNANHKLEALKLPAKAVDDASAARLYRARTYSGQGSRPGLMRSPMAAAVSADGVILVLEDSNGNNRIQAFDIGGNPIPYFKKQPRPYFLQLDATANATYLDLAVEFSGYLYVLSRDDSGNHRLDIYHPEQDGTAPISTTLNINAARIAVDFWRSLYTLNYEVLTLPGSASPPALTEPSVSLWVPPPPNG
jgi:hypothetical protein